MPNKHFYFALGATTGVVISYALRKSRHWLFRHFSLMRRVYRWDRHWFLYFPYLILAFGVLALTPDILHALHILPKATTRGAFFNLFYFHSYFEWLEDAKPDVDWVLNTIGSIALLTIALGIMVFYVREVKRVEKLPVREEHFKKFRWEKSHKGEKVSGDV